MCKSAINLYALRVKGKTLKTFNKKFKVLCINNTLNYALHFNVWILSMICFNLEKILTKKSKF